MLKPLKIVLATSNYLSGMKIVILCVGSTNEDYVSSGLDVFLKRLSHYVDSRIEVIPEHSSWKKMKPNIRKAAEGKAILSRIAPGDSAYLLDEKGTQFTSVGFADHLEKTMNSGVKRIVFIIGGAFGFSDEVYAAINGKMALSKMTFSHQMVRLFFVEQIYRAMTILKNQPYHNK